MELTVTGESDNFNECYCEASMEERHKVIDWYSQGQTLGPFSPGDILWYAVRD